MVGAICHQSLNDNALRGDNTTNEQCAMDFEGGMLSIPGLEVPAAYGGRHAVSMVSHPPGLTLGASGFKGCQSKPDANPIEKQLPVPGPGGGKKKGVVPYVARKLAANLAILSAMILVPFRALMSQITTSVDFVEVACAPTSSLSARMEELGFSIQRVNYKEGFDLDLKAGTQRLHSFIEEKKPKHIWVSLKCTRLSSLNNLTQRDEYQEAAFQKRQARDLKRADEVVQALEPALQNGDDVSWEWPTSAVKGWRSRAIQRLQKIASKHHRHLYWCNFHGCAYGLEFKGFPVQKSWTVATTCREVWLGLQRRCPGHPEHLHCRGMVAQASSYYPADMVKSITKAIVASWNRVEEKAGVSLDRDLSIHLLDASNELEDLDNTTGLCVAQECQHMMKYEAQARQEQPEILALTRQRFPSEMPKGKQLELIKTQMLRVHKAAGHPSMANLQRLLRARQAPPWAVALAGQIQCPDCIEAKQPPSAPVASLHETPGLLEIIGADIFEAEHGGHKFKFMIIRDRASGLVMVEFLKRYGGENEESAWEPNSDIVVKVFSRWMMHNPSPKWIITDSATYYTSQRMMDFAGMSGIGLLTTPAEAHHMLGAEENAIRLIKSTAARLLKDETTMDVEMAYTLATHGHNSSINSTGFSPFQWTRGSSAPMENIPIGINPRKAFDGMLKLKEKARVAFEIESARSRLSKLNNTVPQKIQVFKPGTLAMLWRQKQKPGKTGGMWVGPVRVLLQEGGTIWTATGATLIRARAIQLRKCTHREELQATLEGTAVLRLPITLESLLRNFTGRHFSDVTGEVPSMEQLQDDVQGAEVLVEPPTNVRPDVWSFRQDGGRRYLVRVHHLPRLSLFSPLRMTSCPIPETDLSGKRITKLKGMNPSDKDVVIEDDYKNSDDPHKSLQDRWKGETWLEMKAEAAQPGAAPKTRKVKVDRKRKAEDELPTKDDVQEIDDDDGSGQVQDSSGVQGDPPEGAALPSVPAISPLTTALRTSGADAVDGVPASANVSSGTQCSVDACQLPGGHYGPHEDGDGQEFTWDPYQGRQNLGEEAGKSGDSDSSSSSSGSEELLIDKPSADKIYNNATEVKHTPVKECFYALEVEIGPSDLKYLSKNTDGWSIWLSRKMMEKGKEKRWTQMDLEQKKLFDLAQARELSNVLSSKALRSLTSQEMSDLDPTSVASMRWVLTTKADGSAKARLVILGFQMGNITEVETAAPTMGRVGRYLLLALCANKGYRLKAGDVTSAFLQTDESLEPLGMTVWAPAELAVLFGASPENPVMPLRVMRAFYGLVQSPRCWFNDVSGKMVKHGWRCLLSDRCIFILEDDETHEVIAAAGIHVDDFLLCGDEQHPKYQQAEKMLQETYKWGKWQTGEMTFAGCHIVQLADGSLRVDQQEYVDKWLEEIPLTKQRQQQTKSTLTPREISMLRGAIGTIAWKSAQTGPHFQAEAGLLLSEIPYANVLTILKANKLIREIKRESHQSLLFPCWKRRWKEICVLTWCDAGQQNRPDRSSTMGYVSGLAPQEILAGEEATVAIITWRSSKTPRQCLGSNGAEVQGVTEGEDATFKLRGMWMEINGVKIDRKKIYDQVRDTTQGVIIMDTRGIYDSMVRNVSSLHGLRSSRAGYELTLAVQQAMRIRTGIRWVNGLAMLADCLTKGNERKVFLQFLAANQKWLLVHDERFVAGRKLRKRELEQATRDMELKFIGCVRDMALKARWPWQDSFDDSRSMVDVKTEDPFNHDEFMSQHELGPTFVKLGQVLSIRPDVLPPKTMKELARLQDDIETFSNEEARKVIEKEMGKPVDEIFSSFSEEPIAAASLAQVYRATLRETGQEVAVKVQRPGALSTVSKDLYVLRRLADVVQPLIRRFTADETDYIALTETFAEGLYTEAWAKWELDFRNEALNALRMEELLKESLGESSLEKIVIPRPLMPLTTRRVMLSQWVNGVKLSTLPKEEIKELIAIGQEVFLTQLLDIGFFHGDPHPGNLLKITEGEDAGKLCLLDFGLVAQVPRKDRDIIVSAVVHLGTQNWEALIEDFQELGFLSEDTDKDALVPIMQRVLKPYLKGGGAQAFKNANFQALTQDLLKVNMEVKFSIPPYVSLLARSVATLEGVALQGDPGYQIVAMAYPFVIRRLLKNDSRLSFSALRELLYDPHTRRMRPQRLATMLQASLGVVADADSREGFIDFDSVPKDSAPVSEVVKFLLSPNASKLRPLLNAELAYGLDLVLRRTARRARSTLRDVLAPRVPLVGIRLPQPPLPPLLLPVPRNLEKTGPEAFQNGVDLIGIEEVFEGVFPELNTSEDVDFDTFNDAAKSIFNNGDELPEVSPQTLIATLRAVVQGEENAAVELADALRQSLAGSENSTATAGLG
eukprot:s60_g4.t1